MLSVKLVQSGCKTTLLWPGSMFHLCCVAISNDAVQQIIQLNSYNKQESKESHRDRESCRENHIIKIHKSLEAEEDLAF